MIGMNCNPFEKFSGDQVQVFFQLFLGKFWFSQMIYFEPVLKELCNNFRFRRFFFWAGDNDQFHKCNFILSRQSRG